MTNHRHVDFYFPFIVRRLHTAAKSYLKLKGFCTECGIECGENWDAEHAKGCTLGFAMKAVEKKQEMLP